MPYAALIREKIHRSFQGIQPCSLISAEAALRDWGGLWRVSDRVHAEGALPRMGSEKGCAELRWGEIARSKSRIASDLKTRDSWPHMPLRFEIAIRKRAIGDS